MLPQQFNLVGKGANGIDNFRPIDRLKTHGVNIGWRNGYLALSVFDSDSEKNTVYDT